jgi:multiple sugar transport system ATP-binding protein
MTAITLDSVTKVYDGGVLAVSDLSLDIADGELMVLLGPSGCGKSTVLRMIAGLEELTSGELWFGDVRATDLPPKSRGVAMVFQSGALYPNRTVRGNITFPLMMTREDPAEANAKAAELARVLGIEQTLDRMPRTLSGGQRQRVAIGRAIIRQPSVFLMDEPLSNLDATMRTELRHEVGAMARDLGVTTVYVTHDQVEALALADRIAILRDGQLEDVGTPAQVFDDPATAFVAGFLGMPRINLLAATVQVTADRQVLFELGNQTLALSPDDPRAGPLSRHGGLQVVLGVRSDALAPVSPDGGTNRLSGRLRTLEYHGNQWIAYIESGFEVVNPDAIGPERPGRVNGTPAPRSRSHRASHAGPRRQPLAARFRSALGRAEHVRPEPAASGTHRRADLVLQIDAHQGWETGQPVHLGVDLSRVHFFDQNGWRLDPVTR